MNIADIMKQAGQMQAKMADLQAALEQVLVTGQAGGGLVKVTMSGKFAVKAIEIAPSLLKARHPLGRSQTPAPAPLANRPSWPASGLLVS